MSAKDHYDNHLGNIYVWMCGAFEEKRIAQQNFFQANKIIPTSNGVALDLGAAHGIQAIALANLGFDVTAVDFHAPLLHALHQNDEQKRVHVIEDELRSFLSHTSMQPELIVCMGDTLTHLDTIDQVEEFFLHAQQKLLPGGKLILSFRDLTREYKDEHRFIPVRSDHDRILTCFLEYFPNKVIVHDILHERDGDHWKQSISAYAKLRLNEAMVRSMLIKEQFSVVGVEMISGMIYVIAQKK